ncbi:MAG TPA: hypothetical protein VNI01_09510, partial [Elusimicrobiota bacterium]|nr:hypothetical protein [Elusimicrobiota bacterium]
MSALLALAFLLAAVPARADELSLGGTEELRPIEQAPRRRVPGASDPEKEPPGDNWSSFSMEATAVSGEMHYMERDFSGAKEKFRDSLSSSVRVADPHNRVVALDLFRTAELAARERNFSLAHHNLNILLQ